MDARSTSVAPQRGWPAPPMWRSLVHFLRRPQLPEKHESFTLRAVGEVAQLLLLDLAISFVLLVALGWLSTTLGIAPVNLAPLLRLGPLGLLAAGALGLPIMEECVFRGWLDGRRRTLALFGVLVVTVATIGIVRRAVPSESGQTVLLVILLLGAAAAALAAWRLKPGSIGWFSAAFPAFYFLSALLFGLAHMTNYDLARPLLLLPFVLPQTFAGLIFGFARVRYGMWANIALHSTSNALFLGASLLGA